ncbi:MAG: helix-turn-helix transcriptional regulator [Kiritimatiellae bacterium]|nr:helix-turn-helix transcriptional regulator [Kiritimatiellia bacterium]
MPTDMITRFDGLRIGSVLELGRHRYTRAHLSRGEHRHADGMELCYLASGLQTYWIEGAEYALHGGDGLVILPRERHGLGGTRERSLFYYVIFDLGKPREPFFDLPVRESDALRNSLRGLTERLFALGPGPKRAFDTILRLAPGSARFRATRIRNLLVDLLIGLVRCDQAHATESDPRAVRQTRDYIAAHLGARVTIAELARHTRLSEAQLQKVFKRRTGIPLGEYVLRQKIAAAQRLLRGPGVTVTGVAYDLGFSSSQYFATVFKRYTGIRPSAWSRPDVRHHAAHLQR